MVQILLLRSNVIGVYKKVYFGFGKVPPSSSGSVRCSKRWVRVRFGSADSSSRVRFGSAKFVKNRVRFGSIPISNVQASNITRYTLRSSAYLISTSVTFDNNNHQTVAKPMHTLILYKILINSIFKFLIDKTYNLKAIQ